MKRFKDEEVFVEGGTYPRHKLKERFIKLVEYKCDECGIGNEWNGRRLSLQLDHKNGISNDNRFENLRLICPNCHSQTETYAGKNSKGMRTSGIKPPSFKQMKAARDLEKWKELLKDPSLQIGAWGWKGKVAERLNITPQKVSKWIQRVDPVFYRSLV